MSSPKENIFVFVPNLIGYARIFLALASFYYMKTDFKLAMVFYVTSGLMDALDGYAARYYNQSTRFGAILDQLTDRVGTMCLNMVLGVFYADYLFLFQLSNLIDIAGHWIHIWASLIKGKSSHKYIDPSENKILRIYYSSRPVLFTMCAANELFYVSLYLVHFTEGPISKFYPIDSESNERLFSRTVANLNQGLFLLVAKICFPLAILKHVITLIQVIAACINIAAIDVSEREAMRKSRGQKEK